MNIDKGNFQSKNGIQKIGYGQIASLYFILFPISYLLSYVN